VGVCGRITEDHADEVCLLFLRGAEPFATGLPGLDTVGELLPEVAVACVFSFFVRRPPSLISLSEPAEERETLGLGCGGEDAMLLRLVGFRLSLIIEDFRDALPGAEGDWWTGEDRREFVVELGSVGWDEGCFFFIFLRADSLPLASERLGEPGRLRILRRGLGCVGRFEGVLVPLVVFPEDAFSFKADLALSCCAALSSSSAFLRSSSSWCPSSEPDDSSDS